MRGSCSLLVLAVVLCAVAQAETTIPWDQAAKHVGEETTIEGRVLTYNCADPVHAALIAAGQTRHRALIDLVNARKLEFA